MQTAHFPRSKSLAPILVNALVFNPKNWEGDQPMPSLLENVENFFKVLEERKISFVLVGGVALLHYVEGRNTEDLDLIMALSSVESLPELKIVSQEDPFIRARFENLQVDILLTSHKLFEKVAKNYTKTDQVFGHKMNCVTPEGLILLKFFALPSLYRQGQFDRVGLYENDIATLLHHYPTSLEPLFIELDPYLSETDQTEIRKIADEIWERLKRFEERKS